MSATHTWNIQVLPNVWITLAYTGSGSVSVTPSNCLYPSTCPAQNITVTATPASGYIFLNWSGVPSGYETSNPATFPITSNMTVTAAFVVNGTLGILDVTGSTFNTGPFYPGQTNAVIAHIHVGNNGYKTDSVYRKYMYKNSAGSWVDIQTFTTAIAVGLYVYYDDAITIPSEIQTCAIGSACVEFGVKVWGTGESEPTNPTLTWGGTEISISTIFGVSIGAIAAGLLIWIAHKKGLW